MAADPRQNTSNTTGNQDVTLQIHNIQSVANGRFLIQKSIGKGSFGEIYQGIDTLHNTDVAIKMEYKHCKVKVLEGEAKILKQLQGRDGFPKYHWYGQEGNQNVLVMELLGPSLSQLFKNTGSKFSLPTVLKLAEQILHRIESMHHAGFLHRDIKPNNFVLGLPGTPYENTVYILDFGLSKPFHQKGQHFPQLPPGKSLTGTARYASVNSHQGFTLSRRDDLESIAYMLIQFLRGNLPWQGIGGANKLEKYSNILDLKLSTIEELLCIDLPDQFCKFLKYAKELIYDEKPDYNRWRHEFRILFMDTNSQQQSSNQHSFTKVNNGFPAGERDFLYDWQIKVLQQQQQILNSNKMQVQHQQPLLQVPPSYGQSIQQQQSQSSNNNSGNAADEGQVVQNRQRSHKKKPLNIMISPLSPGGQGSGVQNNLQKNVMSLVKEQYHNRGSPHDPQEMNSLEASKNSSEYVIQDIDHNISIIAQYNLTGNNNGVVYQKGTIEANQTPGHIQHERVLVQQQQVKLQQIIDQYEVNNGPTNQQENTPGGRMQKGEQKSGDSKINPIATKVNNSQGTAQNIGNSSPAQILEGSNFAAGIYNGPPSISTKVRNAVVVQKPIQSVHEDTGRGILIKNQGTGVQPGANCNESFRQQIKQSKKESSSSSSEEELKIPILNNNYEGFKEVEEMHESNRKFHVNGGIVSQKVNNPGAMAFAINQQKPNQKLITAQSRQLQLVTSNAHQTNQPQKLYNPSLNVPLQGSMVAIVGGGNQFYQNDTNNRGVQAQSGQQPAGKKKQQQVPEEFEVEIDPLYIQKQVGEDSAANKVLSFNINLPVFTLNPNQRVAGRQINLSAKQEQSRLNRLKQIYGGHLCPNFLFLREDHNPSSLMSMEPLLIQISENGQLNKVEAVFRGGSM